MSAYLDHAATAPLRPEARQAMLPWLGERFGNPSGAHASARAARAAVDEAREVVAALVGCAPGEVAFCSGGTEADNAAVVGVGRARPDGVLSCSAFEHHAVLEPVEQRGGATIPVTADGIVDLDAVAASVGPRTALVSVMAVNNEVGTIQPVREVAAVVAERAPEAVFHTDAVQAAPWLDLTDIVAGAGLVSLSAHKMGGPQGVGALIVRAGTALAPLLMGGGQERGLRSGTHNVAGIVGMAAALRAAAEHRTEEWLTTAARRDRLVDTLVDRLDAVVETTPRAGRVAGNAHLCIDGVPSESLLFLLDRADVAASAASACASGAQVASHVLAAMGVPPPAASGALRLSLGHTTTDAEVDHAIEAIVDAVGRLRA